MQQQQQPLLLSSFWRRFPSSLRLFLAFNVGSLGQNGFLWHLCSRYQLAQVLIAPISPAAVSLGQFGLLRCQCHEGQTLREEITLNLPQDIANLLHRLGSQILTFFFLMVHTTEIIKVDLMIEKVIHMIMSYNL